MTEPALTRGAVTRTRIVDIAREILATGGLEHFVLREIAKQAAVQLGNLQYYFPTRDDLLEAVIREEFEHNLDAIRALDTRTADLASYIAEFSELLIREYTGVGGKVWPVLTVLHLHHRRFRYLSQEIYQQHFDILIAALRRFGVSGDTPALRQKARLITALLDGASLQAHARPHSRHSREWRSLCYQTAELAHAIAAA